VSFFPFRFSSDPNFFLQEYLPLLCYTRLVLHGRFVSTVLRHLLPSYFFPPPNACGFFCFTLPARSPPPSQSPCSGLPILPILSFPNLLRTLATGTIYSTPKGMGFPFFRNMAPLPPPTSLSHQFFPFSFFVLNHVLCLHFRSSSAECRDVHP